MCYVCMRVLMHVCWVCAVQAAEALIADEQWGQANDQLELAEKVRVRVRVRVTPHLTFTPCPRPHPTPSPLALTPHPHPHHPNPHPPPRSFAEQSGNEA